MLIQYLTIILVIAISQTQSLAGQLETFWPNSYPVCEVCRDPELMVAPGIGFDLTHSYGTAAVRFQNGTSVFLGKAEGSSAFTVLMKYNSQESSRPKSPETVLEKLRYAWEHAKRERNKRRGLPATEDVGTIANMIILLRQMTEIRLGRVITGAVTATPQLPGLTKEDLDDAMEYAGLKMLSSFNSAAEFHEVEAAFAGLGNGLCEFPEDIERCNEEEMYMPWNMVLTISFTDLLFSLTTTACTSANRCWEYRREEDFDLGLGAKDRYGYEQMYWTRMRRTIRRFAELEYRIDKLQLLGEAVSNEHFHEALRGALKDLEPREIAVIGGSNKSEPLGLAARGAAEFAKRFQVMTWGCTEPDWCHDPEIFGQPMGDL